MRLAVIFWGRTRRTGTPAFHITLACTTKKFIRVSTSSTTLIARDLEYDFRLQPDADPTAIRLTYNESVRSDANGDLLIAGLRQKKPKVYQNGNEVACDYVVHDAHHVQLALASYDRSRSLTVDPELVFSTYLGGPGNDSVSGITLDSSGFIYLGMSTQSPAAPILDPFQQETVRESFSRQFLNSHPTVNSSCTT